VNAAILLLKSHRSILKEFSMGKRLRRESGMPILIEWLPVDWSTSAHIGGIKRAAELAILKGRLLAGAGMGHGVSGVGQCVQCVAIAGAGGGFEDSYGIGIALQVQIGIAAQDHQSDLLRLDLL